jgi:hypothetical protein
MRVICLLDEVLRDSPMSVADLRAKLGLDHRTIVKLRKNSGDWRLDADAFGKLMLLGFERGLPNGMFAIRPHPLWRTFESTLDAGVSTSALIYRVSRTFDAKVEATLADFLHRIGCHSTTVIVDRPLGLDASEIRQAMTTRNCIFIGSPKSNAASEVALALLWGATPFESDARNREKIPVHILVPDSERPGASAVMGPGGHGFTIHDPEVDTKRRTISVTWKPIAEYESTKCEGQDAAVVVVAKSPLGSPHDVTTILILGYTGLATEIATRELTLGEPPVSEDSMQAEGIQLLAYKFRYRKPKRAPGATGELRRQIENDGQWGPPWADVCD